MIQNIFWIFWENGRSFTESRIVFAKRFLILKRRVSNIVDIICGYLAVLLVAAYIRTHYKLNIFFQANDVIKMKVKALDKGTYLTLTGMLYTYS